MKRERLMHLIEMVQEINDSARSKTGKLDNYGWCVLEIYVYETTLRVFDNGAAAVYAHPNIDHSYTLPGYIKDPDLVMGEAHLERILETVRGEKTA